jgi:autotransporter-associated beta strand protein
MKSRSLNTSLLSVLFVFATSALAVAQAFVHPGCLSTQADIDRMKAKIAAGAEPWASAYAVLVNNPHSSASYTANPLPYIYRGGSNQNYSSIMNDAAAAYQCALRWKLTGDTSFADAAMRNMDGYSSTLVNIGGSTDALLCLGAQGFDFACAAELLRDYQPWVDSGGFARFQTMLLNKFYQDPTNGAGLHGFLQSHNGTCYSHYWLNWDGFALSAAAAIGVVCDRRDIFDYAVNYYKTSGAGNGLATRALYFMHPGYLGQSQEMGRDMGHASIDPVLFAEFAEVAWNQGEDIYGYNNNAILAIAEYTARAMTADGVPWVNYAGCDVNTTNVATGSIYRAGMDMIWNHYVNRRGLAAPYTTAWAIANRPEGGGGNYGGDSGGFDQIGFTTLTHALDVTTAVTVPSGLQADAPLANTARIWWWGSANATGYNVKRATTSGGPYTVVASNLSARNFLYTDTCLTPGTTYYYVVSAIINGAETADSQPVSVTANQRLTGTVIGTDSIFTNGQGKYQLFDNAPVTWFDASTPSGAWAGLDLGVPHRITKVGYYPRATYASWMTGGQFQGSNVADFSSGVVTLFTITSQPAEGTTTVQNVSDTGAYRYVRYIGPANGYCNAAEIQFEGFPTPAVAPSAPTNLTAVAGNASVSLSWAAAGDTTSFKIKRATTSGGPYTVIASGYTSDVYTDTTVTNGVTYYYVVSGSNATGEGANSAEVSVMPSANALAGSLVWTGTVGNAWDTSSLNWQQSGAILTYHEGDRVLFDDSSGGNTSVNLSAVHTPSAVTFNNGWRSYTLTGSAINCTGAFVKNGGGSVTLTGANTFGGGAILAGGRTIIQNVNSLGTGSLTLTGGTLCASGTMTLSKNFTVAGSGGLSLGSAANLTYSGTITGSGSFTLGDDGNVYSLYLSGTNSLTGGTVTIPNNNNYVRFETTAMGNANTDWVFNNTVAGRTTLDFASGTMALGSLAGNGAIVGNVGGAIAVTLLVGGDNNSSVFSGVIHDNQAGTGSISLTKTGTGTLQLTGPCDYSGATVVNGGALILSTAFAGKGSLQANAGTILGVANTSSASAKLTGLTLAAGSTLELDNVTSALTPLLACSGNVVVNGACTVNVTQIPAGLRPGTYPLVNYTGSFQGTFSNLQLQLPSGVNGSLVNNSGQIALSITSVPAPATPPTVTSSVSNGQIVLNWTGTQYADTYNVWRATTSGGPYTLVATTYGTSYTDTGAVNAGTYYYVVTAGNASGTSGNSTESSVVTLGAGHSVISVNFQGSNTSALAPSESAGVINMSNWNNAGGASGSASALVDALGGASSASVSWASNNTWNLPITESPGNARMMRGYLDTSNTSTTTVTVSGLPSVFTTGSYSVYVYRDGDNGGNPTAGNYTIGSTTINATDNANSNFNGTFTQANNSAGNYIVFTGLTGSSFTLTAQATNARAPINGIQIVATPGTGPVPASPSGVSVVSNSPPKLTWTASPGATSYTVKRATSNGGPYVTLATNVSNTSYIDTNISPLVLYYYVVSAANSAGESSPSAEVSAQPNYLTEYLKFDESSGTTSADSTGNGWTATLVNGPTFATGKYGNALGFAKASSQYATLPSGIVNALGNITISAWVNPTTLDTWARVFDFGSGTATYMFLTTKSGNSGNPRFGIRIGNGTEQDIDASAPLPLNTWTHVAVTLPGSTGTIYVNGVASGTNTSMSLQPSGMGSTTQNYLGKSQWNDPYLNGSIDDFRIYSVALNGAEIASLASGQITAPQNVTATASDTQVSLSWQAVAEARAYIVKRATTSGGPYTVLGVTYSPGYIDTGRAAGTTYYYVISANTAAGESANSAETSVTTIPAAPTGLTTSPSNGHVGLSWNASTGASIYTILRATSLNGPYTTIASGVSGTSYTDTTALPGWTYYYAVAAGNGSGQSQSSASATTTAPAVAMSWLKLDETSGTTAADATDNSNNGTLINSPTWIGGKIGNALGLNSTNQYASLPSSVVSNLHDFTVAAWVYWNGGGNWQRVFDFGSGTFIYMFLTPQNGVTGAPRFAITTTGGSGEQKIDAPSALTTGTWHHIAVTLSGSTGTLYIDGQQVAQNTAMTLRPSDLGSTTQNWIGRSQYNDPYLSGRVDDFRIYAGALTASDIAALAAPIQTTGLTATGGNGQIALAWSSTTGATSYTVRRATVSGGAYTVIASGVTGTSYTDTNLTNGTNYYYVVTPANASGDGANSAEATTATIPAAPTGVAATGGTGQIALTWNASTGANTYNVLRATSPNGGYTTVASGLTSTGYTDTSVSSGTTYYYAVTATNGSGSSANSLQVNAITAPDSPGSITATGGNGQVALSWTASTGAASYSVLRTTSSNGTYTTVATGLTGTSYTDTGLADGTSYYYAITATNGSGSSANSAQVNTITIPAAPTGPSATGGTSQVALTWNASTGASTYNVLRATSANGTYTSVATALTGTSYTDTGLSSGTTYYYAVTATNGSGSSANSTQVNAVPAPASPSSVTATAGNGQVALSWTASTGATGYSVLRAISANGSYTTIASGVTGTSYTDTGLANGTTYYYAVAASNGSGSSSNSSQVNAITAPAAPTGLTATADNAQVSLLWNSSTGAATYNVLRSTTSGSGYVAVASGLSGTSYIDTGLTNGTTYYYVVTATNTGGTSANSGEASGMPVALPSPWATSDIGSTGAVGSASRSPSGVFTLTGAGADIWGSSDAFRYVYQTASGDCDITARVATLQNTNNAAKSGIMIRESLNANSTEAMTDITAANGLEFLRRTTTGGSTGGVAVSGPRAPYWVRLVRSGNTFTSYRSSDGVTWTNVGSVTITMASNVYIGILVCSHVNAVLCTTTIDNVIVNP